jgi:hypothetical protein
VDPNEKNIAICYIQGEGDQNNACELTDHRLIVRRKGKVHEFPLEQVKSLQLNHRRLLIPIIFSGIFTPLIAVGFFEGFFHPVIAALFIVAGIFTFYLGWLGQQVLTINHGQGHTDFSMDNPGQNLLAFMDFTNDYLGDVPVEFRSVFLLSEMSDKSPQMTDITMTEPPYELYSYYHLKEYLLSNPEISEQTIWAIDPLKTENQIRYEPSEDGHRLRPVLNGKIARNAIFRKYTIKEFLLTSHKK